MKRFTLMMLTALIAVFAFAQKGNLKSFEAHPFMLGKTASAPVAMQAKQAPAGLAQKIAAKTNTKRRIMMKILQVSPLVSTH